MTLTTADIDANLSDLSDAEQYRLLESHTQAHLLADFLATCPIDEKDGTLEELVHWFVERAHRGTALRFDGTADDFNHRWFDYLHEHLPSHQSELRRGLRAAVEG